MTVCCVFNHLHRQRNIEEERDNTNEHEIMQHNRQP